MASMNGLGLKLSDASGKFLVTQLLRALIPALDSHVRPLNGAAVHSVANERERRRISSESLLNGCRRKFIKFLRTCIEVAHECSANSVALLHSIRPSRSLWL